jgi:hypothetical protein
METINQPKQLLTSYDDARHILGKIGRTTLYDLIGNGHLEQRNIGRRGFIVTESLERYVNSLAIAAEADEQPAPFPEPPRAERKLAAVTRRPRGP